MTSQEVWVHGTSGNVEDWQDDWGFARPIGWGLHMDVKVRDFAPDGMPWVHFHIPLPVVRPEAGDAPRLQEVFVKFATDHDEGGWFAKYPSLYANQMWKKDAGGAIIRHLHVYDSDAIVQEFNNVNWQSKNLDTYAVESREFPQEPKIYWGLGISLNIWFKNQVIIDYKIHPNTGEEYAPGWWDGKPFYDPALPVTKTKRAVISSVGCRFKTPR